MGDPGELGLMTSGSPLSPVRALFFFSLLAADSPAGMDLPVPRRLPILHPTPVTHSGEHHTNTNTSNTTVAINLHQNQTEELPYRRIERAPRRRQSFCS